MYMIVLSSSNLNKVLLENSTYVIFIQIEQHVEF